MAVGVLGAVASMDVRGLPLLQNNGSLLFLRAKLLAMQRVVAATRLAVSCQLSLQSSEMRNPLQNWQMPIPALSWERSNGSRHNPSGTAAFRNSSASLPLRNRYQYGASIVTIQC